MIEIREIDRETQLGNDNKIMGTIPELEKTCVRFYGSGNILFCLSQTKFSNSTIKFKGNNSLVFISGGVFPHKLSLDIYNDSVFFMGKHNHMTKNIVAVLSEQKNIFIGDFCLFARDVWMRTADAHLIYDVNDSHRLNHSASIYIGDHVLSDEL